MSTHFKQVFGEVLKELREERGLSQMELVRRSEIDRTTIPRYEKGEIMPIFLNLFVLAKALEVEPTEFVSRIKSRLRPEDLKKSKKYS